VHGEIRYCSATALALLHRHDAALAGLEAALQAGWRHAWWARLDWNLRGLEQDSRLAAWLVRLGPGGESPGSSG
jgi:hypothetical protein